jgi:hypothetical protein
MASRRDQRDHGSAEDGAALTDAHLGGFASVWRSERLCAGEHPSAWASILRLLAQSRIRRWSPVSNSS